METPLRLKFDNRLQAELPFHVLVRAMLRRMSSLMNAFAGGEPNLDYRGLVKKAESIEIKENNLSWYDWQRYSFRQDKKMLMGGMTGNVIYSGDISEFLPLIAFCEKVHLGKQTTFGLGKIKTEML
jgi:CRISPR/Cas system endoribonuclease Cas6 (RAMP superfamily)